jgi:hypothetical protein
VRGAYGEVSSSRRLGVEKDLTSNIHVRYRSSTGAPRVPRSQGAIDQTARFHKGVPLTRPLIRSLARLCLAIGFGLVGAIAIPAAAQADLVNLNPCNNAPLTQPFARWADPASYELAPGGDFENSAWSLTGGAQLVPGSEPYAATGSVGSTALSLPSGSSAESPSTCVDAAYPTIRFFIGGTGTVAVSLVDHSLGDLVIPTVGVAAGSGSWQPSPVAITTSPVLGLLGGGTAQVSVRLTALSGSPQVDDVFIDPWNRS